MYAFRFARCLACALAVKEISRTTTRHSVGIPSYHYGYVLDGLQVPYWTDAPVSYCE